MANSFEGGRQVPYPLVEDGKGYQQALDSRARAILSALMNLLPSNYESTIVGPNYTLFLKAFAQEFARVALTLEQLSDSIDFERVPSEFLWETVGYLVFVNGKLPELGFDDESFREFLLAVIDIFFKGSTPEAIAEGIALFTDSEFTIRELYKEAQRPGSPYDISDQFAFLIDFDLQGQFAINPFDLGANVRLLLEIIRPAHTLYQLRFVFGEDINEIVEAVEDAVSYDLRLYYYEDARYYCDGIAGFASTTGEISNSNLYLLTDTDTTKPLSSVQAGARLIVTEGVNTGWYEVVSNSSGTLRVFPRFAQAESGVSYTVEVDRYGKKREIFVEDEVATTSIPLERLTVDAGGPYTIDEFTTQALAATVDGNYGTVTFSWDFTGDDNYTDATGATPNYTAGNGPDTQTISVRVVDEKGREAKAFALVTIEDTSQVQAYGTATASASGTYTASAASASTSSATATVTGTYTAQGVSTGNTAGATSTATAQLDAEGQAQGTASGTASAEGTET